MPDNFLLQWDAGGHVGQLLTELLLSKSCLCSLVIVQGSGCSHTEGLGVLPMGCTNVTIVTVSPLPQGYLGDAPGLQEPESCFFVKMLTASNAQLHFHWVHAL